jgi:hypothetical protein
MAHWLALAGLVLNTVGAGLLLWYSPATRRFTKDGREAGTWVNNPTPEGLRGYRRQMLGFGFAIGSLIAGFFLQLLALLCP